jgi:hypothetical protein
MRSLEILIHLIAHFPSEATQLCTADKNLALFWCGLNIDDIVNDGAGVRYTINPHPALLSQEYFERWSTAVSGSAAKEST